MNDLEICKRIAEIESHTVDCEFRDFIVVKNGGDGKAFSPLKDKALCFDLMIKYGVKIDYINGVAHAGFGCSYWFVDENPQRAICLAIIAKHEDNNEN